jgi:hypothetical protein
MTLMLLVTLTMHSVDRVSKNDDLRNAQHARTNSGIYQVAAVLR